MLNAFATLVELPCYVKPSLYIHVRKIRASYGEKESRWSDWLLFSYVRTHPYKLLTILFMPSRRCTSPDIRRHCYFSASKNTKLLKKAGRSLSKDLCSLLCSDSTCPLCMLIEPSKNLELSSDPVLSYFSYMHENWEMLDSRLLCGCLIVSYVKDLKIGMTKLFIK